MTRGGGRESDGPQKERNNERVSEAGPGRGRAEARDESPRPGPSLQRVALLINKRRSR